MECKLQPLERSLAGECNHTDFFFNLAGNDPFRCTTAMKIEWQLNIVMVLTQKILNARKELKRALSE